MMTMTFKRLLQGRNLVLLVIVFVIAWYLEMRYTGLSGSKDIVTEENLILKVEPGCDLVNKPCHASGHQYKMTLSLLDSPSALKPFGVKVEALPNASHKKQPVQVAFNMQGMDMGVIRHRLLWDEQQQAWTGEVILPVCATGRRDWMAEVSQLRGQQKLLANFTFELTQ